MEQTNLEPMNQSVLLLKCACFHRHYFIHFDMKCLLHMSFVKNTCLLTLYDELLLK